MSAERNQYDDEWYRFSEPELFRQSDEPGGPPEVVPQAPRGAMRPSDEGCGGAALTGPRKVSKAFVKGPIDFEWTVRAAHQKKPALMIGVALWREVGLAKDCFLQKGLACSQPIKVRSSIRKKMGMSTSQMSRGIRALAAAGLIVILKGGVGRLPIVAIRNVHVLDTKGGAA